MSRKKSFPIIQILLAAYYIIAIGTLIFRIYTNNLQGAGMVFVAMITPWIVPVALRIVHLHMTKEFWILNILFMFFASLIGSCLGGYTLPFFDKILHFCSGLFATCLAIILFWNLNHTRDMSKVNHSLFYLFVYAINLSIALLWEFFEYAMLVFFQNDAIHHFDTGVHDSMTDMLCAAIAGLLIILGTWRWMHHHKPFYLLKACIRFFDTNRIK